MDCIFCRIIAGEIPSAKVYEDERVFAFKDINPQAPVHVLVVPKAHLESVDAVTAENSGYVAAIFEAIPKIAAEAGASYIISPDTDVDVIRKTRELGLVSLPGAYTPSEAKQAYNAGADFVKLFPCVGDAPAYIKALCGPLNHIRFLAVGGVNENNAADFLKAGALGVGVGGNLVNKDWIKAGEYDKVRDAAKKYVASVNYNK